MYAGKGIYYTFATQRNMRVHGVITTCAIALSLYLHISRVEWMILLLAVGLVMGLEMLNTSLETTLDFVSREQHPEIGIAKDVAAGAVLVAAFCCVFVGLGLWGERLLLLLYSTGR